jgi:hypothetical protein
LLLTGDKIVTRDATFSLHSHTGIVTKLFELMINLNTGAFRRWHFFNLLKLLNLSKKQGLYTESVCISPDRKIYFLLQKNWKYRGFRAQADWTLAHTNHKDTKQSTVEASITLDGVTLTDSLIRWLPNKWPSVCRAIPYCLPRCFGRLISLYNGPLNRGEWWNDQWTMYCKECGRGNRRPSHLGYYPNICEEVGKHIRYSKLAMRPCHSSGRLSPASHRCGVGSSPAQVMLNMR